MSKSNIKLIGENIRNQRLVKNYSQDYVAGCLGISQNAYSKIELGYTRITLDRAFIIANIFEVDVLILLSNSKKIKIKRIQEINEAENEWLQYYGNKYPTRENDL